MSIKERQKKTMEVYEITKCEKLICGVKTEYCFLRIGLSHYRIKIRRGNSEAESDFNGDFFNVVGLFKTMIDTDTLPENLSEIACDIKNSFCV